MILLYRMKKRGTIHFFDHCTGTGDMMKKYEQLALELKEAIKGERWTDGQRLPSIRSLSKSYEVSKSTVIQALDILQQEHFLYVVPRGGYYVMTQSKSLEEPLDFQTVKPDNRLIPYQSYKKCIDKAIDHYKYQMFGYTDTEGLPSLRKILMEDLKRHCVYSKYEQIIVTSGAQQGLYILLMILKQSAKALLMEEPGYQLVFDLAKQLDIDVKIIERSDQGYDMKQFEKILKTSEIGMFYCNPRFQNPTGTTLSEKQKKQLWL